MVKKLEKSYGLKSQVPFNAIQADGGLCRVRVKTSRDLSCMATVGKCTHRYDLSSVNMLNDNLIRNN